MSKPALFAREGSGVAGLSARQLEVAGLVAEGMTNKQIAASLYLSEKTVEAHLSSVFAKLGVSGRRGVGAVLERDRARS